MLHVLIVGCGGALGAASRHLVNIAALRAFGSGFPYGTLTVNVVGGVLMGVLGGFTTFSAFSLDAILLWERGAIAAAALYVGASVLLSIAALALGLGIVRALT